MANQKPLCAVRGLLHGGRAVCGSVINAKLCGYEGDCGHQRQQHDEADKPCPECGERGCTGECFGDDMMGVS